MYVNCIWGGIMAVVPKHSDHHKGYDPKDDLTLGQIHRFTKTANRAQHDKDEQTLLNKSIIEIEDTIEDSIEAKDEEFVQQKIEQAKKHRKKEKSQRFFYVSLALSLATLSLAIMTLFN